ncbi:MAG: membrane-bound proton-translocating pyrophosphatase, partial [uncultured bacterium]
METIIKLSFGTSLVTIFYSIYLIRNILSFDAGDKKMLEISEAISEGAGAYLKRQYKTVFIVAAFLLVLLWLSLGLPSALGFALGALASACTGFVGMNVAVRSNSRTTQAAKHGLSQALSV